MSKFMYDLTAIVLAALSPQDRARMERKRVAAYIDACIVRGETDRTELIALALRFVNAALDIDMNCPNCRAPMDGVPQESPTEDPVAVTYCKTCGYIAIGDLKCRRARKRGEDDSLDLPTPCDDQL